MGANSPRKAKMAIVISLSSSFVLGVCTLFFAVMIRNVWAGMFTKDVDIITLTSTVLPIIGLCELGNCPQTTGCGVLRGAARPKLGANINLGCFYLVGMPMAICQSFYLGFDFGGLGCFFGLLVLLRTDWEEQVERARELTAAISESFVSIDHSGGGDDDDDEFEVDADICLLDEFR